MEMTGHTVKVAFYEMPIAFFGYLWYKIFLRTKKCYRGKLLSEYRMQPKPVKQTTYTGKIRGLEDKEVNPAFI
jgi:hypothetical protein